MGAAVWYEFLLEKGALAKIHTPIDQCQMTIHK